MIGWLPPNPHRIEAVIRHTGRRFRWGFSLPLAHPPKEEDCIFESCPLPEVAIDQRDHAYVTWVDGGRVRLARSP